MATVKLSLWGNFPAFQWLGLCTSTAAGPGSIPGQGTKIPQAALCGLKKTKQNKTHPNKQKKLSLWYINIHVDKHIDLKK